MSLPKRSANWDRLLVGRTVDEGTPSRARGRHCQAGRGGEGTDRWKIPTSPSQPTLTTGSPTGISMAGPDAGQLSQQSSPASRARAAPLSGEAARRASQTVAPLGSRRRASRGSGSCRWRRGYFLQRPLRRSLARPRSPEPSSSRLGGEGTGTPPAVNSKLPPKYP